MIDFGLPDCDGLAVIRRLRELQPDLFFIVVSGISNLDLPKDPTIDGSIASVVSKPWDADELEACIRMAVCLRSERRQAERSEGLRVLLVEDSQVDAVLVDHALARSDLGAYTVTIAERLSAARAILNSQEVDVVITDLSLPDARGLDTVKRIQVAAPSTALIVVSGADDEALMGQAIQLGAQDYLHKNTLESAALERAIRYAVDRKRSEAALWGLAHYDQLTAIANRTLFMERLRAAVARARRTRKPCAVLLLDLDGFKDINDRLGHAAGDQVLQEVARRLKRAIREPDVPSRFGGDEFAVLLDPADTAAAASMVAERVAAAVGEPIRIGEASASVTASVGIAVFGHAGTTPKALLATADEAMYEAKRARPSHERSDAR